MTTKDKQGFPLVALGTDAGRFDGRVGQLGQLVATYHFGHRTAQVVRLGTDPRQSDYAIIEVRNGGNKFVDFVPANPNLVTGTPTREIVADLLTLGVGSAEIVR